MKYICFVFCVVLWVTASAQPRLEKHFSYKNYTTYDGLAQSQVTHLYQDQMGYLWVCTKEGISRFDGRNFKNFQSEKGRYSLNSIVKMFEYNDLYYLVGNKSIEIFKGVDLFYKGAMHFPSGYSSMPPHEDAYFLNDTLYLFNCQLKGDRRFGHLMFLANENRFQQISTTARRIRFLYVTNSNLYFLSDSACYQLKENVFAELFRFENCYHDFLVVEENTLLGCEIDKFNQLFKIKVCVDSLSEELYSMANLYVNGSQPNTIFSFPSNNRIYYQDKNKNLNVLSGGRKRVLTNIDMINSVLEDRDGSLWMGTEEGIYNFNRQLFEEYKFNVGEKVDNVWTILQDQDKKMWFGGYPSGIWSLTSKGKIAVETPTSLGLDNVKETSFQFQYMGGCKDSHGDMFFPFPGSLLVVNDRRCFVVDSMRGVSLYLFNDEKNNRILALGAKCNYQISKFDWKPVPIPGETHTIVSCVELNDGTYLLGSYHQQYVYNGVLIKPCLDSTAYKGVISMCKDSFGNIWKGTTDGLFLATPKGEKQIAQQQINGISIGSVYQYNNLLFVGANRSLYLLDIDGYYKNNDERVKVFNQHNGFVGMDNAQNGFFLDCDSFLWYPAVDKVIRFKPEELEKMAFPKPPTPFVVSVTAINKDNKSQIFYEPNSAVELSPNTNALRFVFFASNFNCPENVIFRYKLVGYEKKWSEPTSEAMAIFANLGYGDYRLEIQSATDGSGWSSVYSTSTYFIPPCWWQLWFVRIGFILLAISFMAIFIVLIVKARQRQIIQKLDEQRRLNELRLQSVRSKHIPHFSGNALANIEHFLFSSDLRQANRFLSNYSKLMNITLRDADLASRSIKQEIEHVSLYLELEKMRFQDKIEFSFEIDPKVDQKFEIPNMLLHTWVENAIKHGLRHLETTGKIVIKIRQNQSGLRIIVADNGVGREKSKELGTSGSRIGLKILNEQISIYNHFNKNKAKIQITDLKDRFGQNSGTQFELVLPIDFKFEN